LSPSPAESAIGKLIAENLVSNGATLQMGIGSIPNAVLARLSSHRDLGVHTEMFSDGILPLVESGVITNAKKKENQGRIVTSFCSGTRRLYDFIDDNPLVRFLDVSYVNNSHIISKQPKMTAINACVEIDITGQVVSDSIGPKIYSGVGGQVDFLKGASLNPEGKPILALPSRTNKGIPRIVPTIKAGAGVVTGRALVHHVVTEHGIACLFGKSLQVGKEGGKEKGEWGEGIFARMLTEESSRFRTSCLGNSIFLIVALFKNCCLLYLYHGESLVQFFLHCSLSSGASPGPDLDRASRRQGRIGEGSLCPFPSNLMHQWCER